MVKYSSKYKQDNLRVFSTVLLRLQSNNRATMDKKELIELVKLVYTLNPDGKGKQRKRTLDQVIDIINSS
jgi:hypothetical protein